MCAFEKKRLYLVIFCRSDGRESVCNAGDLSLFLGSGRAPGERNGYPLQWASLVAQLVKNWLQCGRHGFSPWVTKIPWRRERLPTPVFWPGEFHGMYVHGVTKSLTQLRDFHFSPTPVLLPGEFHGQRSLVGYSPWSHKELDRTEQLILSHILWKKSLECGIFFATFWSTIL